MRRYWLYLPLLTLTPLGIFLSSYLEGARILAANIDSYFFIFSWLILPFCISVLFIFLKKPKGLFRLLVFIGVFLSQYVLTLLVTPPGATAEMMGIAYRLRQEFPPGQIRDCANLLRKKYHEGILKAAPRGGYSDALAENAAFVQESELPDSLRGRFRRVYIRPSFTAEKYVSSDEVVVFALTYDRGIYCNDRKHMSESNVYSMADGVHAYRFMRQ